MLSRLWSRGFNATSRAAVSFRSSKSPKPNHGFIGTIVLSKQPRPPAASFSTGQQPHLLNRKSSSEVSVKQPTGSGAVQTTFAAKAKENVKTASYGSVIVIGLGITGVVVYNLFQELMSGDSPNSLFQLASDKCIENPKVQDMLGEPIKAFGEENRRGRRRHVSYMDYVDDQGKKGVRVQFYLQGIRKRATCQIDAREDQSGHMKTRFIIVTADDLLKTTVVVEDNR